MRLSVGDFGAMPLAAMRVLGACLLLVPIVTMRGELGAMLKHGKNIALVGVVGSALPFVMFGVAAQVLTGGVMSILNATTPMWGAVFMWLLSGDKLTPARMLGLVLGFCGVAWLAWDTATIKTGTSSITPAMGLGACVVATVGYGFVAAWAKKTLKGVPPMATAAGSQIGAALVLAVPAIVQWPSTTPKGTAWLSVAALALVCTGVAYVLYFRLIANVGAANATTVTFLIPVFAVLWGTLLLAEPLTLAMGIACALILLGTGLSTGLIGAPRKT